MNKYRIEYCEENGIKVKEFNKYNVNNYTNFLEKKLEAINYTHCCKSDSELLPKRLSNRAYNNAKTMRYEDFVKWWDEQV